MAGETKMKSRIWKVAGLTGGISWALLAAIFALPAAQAQDSLVDAIKNGRPLLDIRYRFEYVDQDGKPENARAHTVRTKLGYETASFYDFGALLEIENSTTLGGESFNNTVNRKTRYPVVADPEATEVNQAYLTYGGIPDTRLHAGRRAIKLDNHRFVGNVGFRQNEQTFDSATVTNSTLTNLTAQYSYVFGVQRIFGDDSPVGDFDTRSHLVHLAYDRFEIASISGYGYLLDLDQDAPGLSSKTFGLRAKGAYPIGEAKLLYTAEFAHQSDYASNPSDFGLPYFLIEPGVTFRGLTAKAGFESLGGDGRNAFQTPYATLHAFQGWADVFLTTPTDGIEDYYASLSYAFDVDGLEALDGLKLTGVYHVFEAENSSTDYGSEWDFNISKKFYDRFTLALTYANYSRDQFAADIERFWVTVAFKY